MCALLSLSLSLSIEAISTFCASVNGSEQQAADRRRWRRAERKKGKRKKKKMWKLFVRPRLKTISQRSWNNNHMGASCFYAVIAQGLMGMSSRTISCFFSLAAVFFFSSCFSYSCFIPFLSLHREWIELNWMEPKYGLDTCAPAPARYAHLTHYANRLQI